MESHVDLGFVEDCDPQLLTSAHFPSKIGGRPAWLTLDPLPTADDLKCATCNNPMVLLLQVYAPIENDDENFHRTVFVFICRTAACCQRNSATNVKAFRNSLPRRNEFYSYEPLETAPNSGELKIETKLCNLCGCSGSKRCGKCKIAYCSREHQIFDWKEGHRNECNTKSVSQRKSSLLFTEFELVIDSETIEKSAIDESEQLDKFEQLEIGGTMQELASTELEQFTSEEEEDKVFGKFQKRILDNPGQVLRYDRGGVPLWIAEGPKPEAVPNCTACNSPRQFEFQIMPQLLNFLNEHELDWGIICVFTCKNSCSGNYLSEFVFRQDVTIN